MGSWSATIELNNVPVHASLMPDSTILYWGRREDPKARTTNFVNKDNRGNLNETKTKAFVWNPEAFFWDPTSKTSKAKGGDITKAGRSEVPKDEPRARDKTPVNLFCSGHCHLPDGNLLIVGGHDLDGQGINQACVYNFNDKVFLPQTEMNEGRWYPSALPLPDGRVMVMSGSQRGENFKGKGINAISQIWTGNPAAPWKEVISSKDKIGPAPLPLYPRLHLSPKGRIFMAGPNSRSSFLDLKDGKVEIETEVQVDGKQKNLVGRWVDTNVDRPGMFRDYAPSVLYDTGKIMYIGGGMSDNMKPTNLVAFTDLNKEPVHWTEGPNMVQQRRQFNATILPDGTVLVTGGTSGADFNNLSTPVFEAELYDPYTGPRGTWTTMAKESVARQYHSVALLLPDGRVMSGGGGEYGQDINADIFCFPNAQFFEPPYLHKAGTSRPVIKNTNPEREIFYGKEVTVTLDSADKIDKISWVRLGSVTHCRNMNQSFMWLQQKKPQDGATLTIAAPENGNVSPPGHYMLFVLKKGIPSVGKIMRISAPPDTGNQPAARMMVVTTTMPVPPEPTIQPTLAEHSDALMAERGHPSVSVGITPVCPYGLGACWAGAYDGLMRMSDVDVVCPVAHAEDSTAHVYLTDDNILPDIDKWRREFAQTINASYDMRGIEMTLSGMLAKKGDQQRLALTLGNGKELPLTPYQQASQIRWDYLKKAPQPVTDTETGAYKHLEVAQSKGKRVQVTGTLQKLGEGKFSLDVRDFKVLG